MGILFGLINSVAVALFKYWKWAVGGAVIIACAALLGCVDTRDFDGETVEVTEKTSDIDPKTFALGAKTSIDSSHKENHSETNTNNSITIGCKEQSEEPRLLKVSKQKSTELPELPAVSPDMVKKAEVSKIVDANVKERMILVNAEAKAKVLAAEAESAAYVKNMEANYKLREQKLLADLADSKGKESKSKAVVEITEAKAKLREVEILAEGKVKVNTIRAEAENLRLIIWIIGVGAGVIALVFLLIESPLKWFHRRRKAQVVDGED